MSDQILGSIMYLKSQEVDNLLEGLEGGLIEQFVEKTKETGTKKKGGSIGVKAGVELSAQGNLETVQEQAHEITKKPTPISRLIGLRKLLIDSNYLPYINIADTEQYSMLAAGRLVEVTGAITLSRFYGLVDQMDQTIRTQKALSTILSNPTPTDPKIEEITKYLSTVTSQSILIYVQPEQMGSQKRHYDFACVLDPKFLRVAREELDGNVNVLARVRKVMKPKETHKVYDLMPGTKVSPALLEDLVQRLNTNTMGGGIKKRDFQLEYPTILLSPIAIYT